MKRLMLIVVVLLHAAPVHAQDIAPDKRPDRPGMVFADNGWHVPTPVTAMEALFAPPVAGHWVGEPAVAVLRQQFEPRGGAELEAMVDQLVDHILETAAEYDEVGAVTVLLLAAAELAGRGVRSMEARDGLVRIYETWDERGDRHNAQVALGFVYDVDVQYVRDVFEAAEKPEPCTPHTVQIAPLDEDEPPMEPPGNLCPSVSKWCDAGRMLMYDGRHIRPVPGTSVRRVVGAPDLEEFERLCEWGRSIHH